MLQWFPMTSSDKPSKELFDFTRVEHERMQETEALRNRTSTPKDLDSVIPLAGENSPLRVASNSSLSSYRVVPPDVHHDRRIRRQKAALFVFLTFCIAIPALIVGGGWGFHLLSQPLKRETSEELEKKLRESDVMRALQTKRHLEGGRVVDSEPPTPQEYGALLVETLPKGAQVYLNNRTVPGQTPIRLGELPANTNIQVVIRKPGYEESFHALNIRPGEERQIYVELNKAR